MKKKKCRSLLQFDLYFFLHHLDQVKEGGNTLQLQDHHQGEKAALPT